MGKGRGKGGKKSIYVVNASKKDAELLDKDITPLDSQLFCLLSPPLSLSLIPSLSVFTAFMWDVQGLSATGTAAFPDHRVKAVRKPRTSETQTCQSNKPCQETAKPHNAPVSLLHTGSSLGDHQRTRGFLHSRETLHYISLDKLAGRKRDHRGISWRLKTESIQWKKALVWCIVDNSRQYLPVTV